MTSQIMTKNMKTLKEMFDDIATAKQKRSIVKKLEEHDNFFVRTVLMGNYHNGISFPFPAGAPPYEPAEDVTEISESVLGRLGKCTTAARGQTLAKEKIFIDILEKLPPEDVEIVIKMKDGELEDLYPKLTEEAVKAAFPTLLK